MQQLQQQAERLRLDLDLNRSAQPQRVPALTPEEEEVLKPLQQELQNRLWQAQELDATLSQTQGALQTAEQRLQVRLLHTQTRQIRPVIGPAHGEAIKTTRHSE